MKNLNATKLQILVLALSTLGAPQAFAGKPGGGGSAGVVTIDRDNAAAGGVTNGDAPGFPVTLSEPGSYRLESNLTVLDASTTAIEITADDVTVDLNGFVVSGPNVCPSPGVCDFSFGGTGIVSTADHSTILGGTVRGMGGAAIALGKYARVERVDVRHNGSIGIRVGLDSLVSDSVAELNFTYGLSAGNGSLVLRNIFSRNKNGAFVNDPVPTTSKVVMGSNVFVLNSIQALVGNPVQILPNVCFGVNCF